MKSLMDLQTTSSRVAFVAARMGTNEGFLSSVSELVSLEVSFSNELLFALVANERSFASMGPHMSF